MEGEGNPNIFEHEYRNAYNVKLDAFEGPLDLLLHLIKKNELDIYDIPLSVITRQYLEYIKLMKELNLEIAGEFLVMAATLIQIKSRTLLPPVIDEEATEEDEDDPRKELIRRLLEYQKYKEAAALLDGRDLLGRDVFARKFESPELLEVEPEDGPLEVELFELIEAFQRVLKRIPAESFHEVGADSISISDRITEILSFLQDRESIEFDDLFPESFGKEYLIATFLAVLELCKLKMIKIVQAQRYGAIWIMPAVAADDSGIGGEESLG